MGIFNHISKNKSTDNIVSGTTRFDLIFSDNVRSDDLDNYHKKSEPIDMGGNRITSLGEPTKIFNIEDLLQRLEN